MTSDTGQTPAFGDLFFLYGTLRPGGPRFRGLGLTGRLVPAGRGAMAGTLYDLGDYPGLIPDGRGQVRGALARLTDPRVVAALDRYEGFDPAAPDAALFQRVRAPLLGRSDMAWVYVYARAVTGRAVVASGRWAR